MQALRHIEDQNGSAVHRAIILTNGLAGSQPGTLANAE
jgi:hypothetical protein